MKTCSKCGVEKGEINFSKSTRYKDGLFCQCKECVRKTRDERLAANPMCGKCGKEPHRPNMPYCMACSRALSGRAPEPKFHRDKENKTMCSKCKVEPRLSYSRYCQSCKNKASAQWWKDHPGYAAAGTEQGKRATIRRYVKTMVDAGKFEKWPCEICGDHDSEAHHYAGYEPEHRLDVLWVCKKHHTEMEQGKIKVDIREGGVVVITQTCNTV